ncbi:hypothetical protein ACXIUS_30590 [Bosea thiooxidans]
MRISSDSFGTTNSVLITGLSDRVEQPAALSANAATIAVRQSFILFPQSLICIRGGGIRDTASRLSVNDALGDRGALFFGSRIADCYLLAPVGISGFDCCSDSRLSRIVDCRHAAPKTKTGQGQRCRHDKRIERWLA